MKEQFTLAASGGILSIIDAAARCVGVSRGQAFDDFLIMARCALSGGTMEEEYLATVAKGYADGKQGSRGVDHMTRAFAELVMAMDSFGQDVLGDIFTGGITYGEQGQFFTPDSVCHLMSALIAPTEADDEIKSVNDPACGSGRLLLATAKSHPNWEFVGQDADHRCAQMTAINLSLNGLRGWAVWQNSLTLECHRIYRIQLDLNTGGVIREFAVEDSPFCYERVGPFPKLRPKVEPVPGGEPKEPRPPSSDHRQLDLF